MKKIAFSTGHISLIFPPFCLVPRIMIFWMTVLHIISNSSSRDVLIVIYQAWKSHKIAFFDFWANIKMALNPGILNFERKSFGSVIFSYRPTTYQNKKKIEDLNYPTCPALTKSSQGVGLSKPPLLVFFSITFF